MDKVKISEKEIVVRIIIRGKTQSFLSHPLEPTLPPQSHKRWSHNARERVPVVRN